MRFSFHLGWVMAVAGVSLLAGAASRGELGFGLLMLMSLTGTGLLLVWLCRDWGRPLEGAEELIRHGRPANATVKRVDDVSLERDGSRTARLTVHVTPPNETSYRTTQRVTLPHGRVPAVGEAVAIRFDPNRRRQFALPGLGQ
jgi:sporulation protein YlmC with PRC-barrel domain